MLCRLHGNFIRLRYAQGYEKTMPPAFTAPNSFLEHKFLVL